MLRATIARLRRWTSRRGGSDGGAGDGATADHGDGANDDHDKEPSDGESGFVRSVLDASVLVGHGQGDPKAAREVAEIQEEAAMLSEQDQYRD